MLFSLCEQTGASSLLVSVLNFLPVSFLRILTTITFAIQLKILTQLPLLIGSQTFLYRMPVYEVIFIYTDACLCFQMRSTGLREKMLHLLTLRTSSPCCSGRILWRGWVQVQNGGVEKAWHSQWLGQSQTASAGHRKFSCDC